MLEMHLENLVLRFHMPYITLTSFIILVNVYLFNLYRFAKNGSHTSRRPWSRRQLGFSPADLGGFSHWRLTLASVAGLFLELLLIRWICSEIHVLPISRISY